MKPQNQKTLLVMALRAEYFPDSREKEDLVELFAGKWAVG